MTYAVRATMEHTLCLCSLPTVVQDGSKCLYTNCSIYLRSRGSDHNGWCVGGGHIDALLEGSAATPVQLRAPMKNLLRGAEE